MQVKCASNLRQMGQAMTMYINDWKYYPGHGVYEHGTFMAVWPTRLRKYCNNIQDVFYCPAQDAGFRWPRSIGVGTTATAQDEGWGYFPNETILDVQHTPFCYGYNDWVRHGARVLELSAGARTWRRPLRHRPHRVSAEVQQGEGT